MLQLLTVLCLLTSETGLPTFPGAEGFGAYTKGGRGGRILFVTNCNDHGPGSLRAACEVEGPRFVLFRVSGIIELQSTLKISHPYLTIAGQTAPGDGICLRRFGCSVATHDVVIRFLRFRPGDESRKEMDALSVSGQNVVIDHCSASWAIDETLSVTNSDNVTVQWCFITESLNNSHHKKGPHGYGSLITGAQAGISFHHNLYASHNSRNPRPGGVQGDAKGLLLDFKNNVIYNWGGRAGYSSETAVRINYVANYLLPGPSTRNPTDRCAFLVGGTATRIHIAGNSFNRATEPNCDDSRFLQLSKNFQFPEDYIPADATESVPFDAPSIAESSADVAFQQVLDDAGCSRPLRDDVDKRIVREIGQRKGRIIDSQAQVGGWPQYRSVTPSTDTDADGIPDVWERAHGLNPKDPADAGRAPEEDGYTNIERYCNTLATRDATPPPSPD